MTRARSPLSSTSWPASCPAKVNGEMVLMDLLDAVIDRSADILERVGAEVDQISHSIFEPEDEAEPPSYKEVLKALGRKGDLTSKVRESLVSIGRLLLFLANEAEGLKWPKDARANLQSMRRDVASLSDHATYLANKITFLLDAMLGVVNHRTERDHQDFLDCGRDFHAADARRLDLRHELPSRHDRARMGVWLSVRVDTDSARCRVADHVLQMEEMAVRPV